MKNIESKNIKILNLRQQILSSLDSTLTQKAYKYPDSDDAYKHPRKPIIRRIHGDHRTQSVLRIQNSLGLKKINQYVSKYFALGQQINPEKIDPVLMPVSVKDVNAGSLKTSQLYSDLFRLITTTWSVPPTAGYGRKLRWVVFDRFNDKVIGILALNDPVIGLSTRDEWIGWDQKTRHKNLKFVMNAYAVGAVPPYSTLLAGKLITCLMASDEISDTIRTRYQGEQTDHSKMTGVDSTHTGDLALITVTSSFGRSSLYNRVHLPQFDIEDPTQLDIKKKDRNYLWQLKLHKLGATKGFGHFQLSDEIFEQIKSLLILEGGKSREIAEKNKYGSGANWKIRVIQEGLKVLNLPSSITNHSLFREVFALPLADNFREYLNGRSNNLIVRNQSIQEITAAAKERWMLPRAQKLEGYKNYDVDDLLSTFRHFLDEKMTYK